MNTFIQLIRPDELPRHRWSYRLSSALVLRPCARQVRGSTNAGLVPGFDAIRPVRAAS